MVSLNFQINDDEQFSSFKLQINPAYPSVKKVKEEIVQMLKGIGSSAILPSLSIYLTGSNFNQGFCGWGGM